MFSPITYVVNENFPTLGGERIEQYLKSIHFYYEQVQKKIPNIPNDSFYSLMRDLL